MASVVSLSVKNLPKKADSLFKSTEFAEILDVDQELPPFSELIPSPAFTYPFELDTFQKQAILCLEDKKNVFVAAHTSAGKTVVAEYAIALSIKRNLTRVVYTSPIKALSNQKFRDFCTTFGSSNIGILTGDVQIRNEAPCLIMTTEILLHMLYRGASLVQDIEWVIFDEVHYVNDPERGHVWEEVFIMLPHHINIVLLSATVPNVVDFADWLGRTRKSKIHVVYTTKRPVPLEHYLYTGCDGKTINEKFLLIDSQGKLREENYRKAMAAKKERESKYHKSFGPINKSSMGSDKTVRQTYITVIRHLAKEQQLPVIIFTFSRRRCDQYARMLASPLDLTTAEEKGRIQRFIHRSLLRLKAVDRSIPQIKEITGLLKNGLGIHHSGILPLLKEITEILFTEGLVRALFATETFSMGINMPARSVIFDSIQKHDGKVFRDLEPSEYIQMAGRAGRRGKDKTGNVLILCKGDIPEMSILARMTVGKATELQSQFRLTYSMILNNLRVREHIRIESIMERSFGEHQPKKCQLESCEFCGDLREFCNDVIDCRRLRKEAMPIICRQLVELKKMKINGRLIVFDHEEHPFMLGIIYDSRTASKETIFDVLGLFPEDIVSYNGEVNNLRFISTKVFPSDIIMILKDIVDGADFRIQREKDGLSLSERPVTKKCIENTLNLLAGHSHERPLSCSMGIFFLDEIDPIKEMGLNKLDQVEVFDSLEVKRNHLRSRECLICPNFLNHFKIMMTRISLETKLSRAKFELSRESLSCLPDYECKVKVLKSLDYITDDEEMVLKLKGKIGCSMSEHELILTELITENLLADLSPPYIASLLSIFVYQQNSEPPEFDETMKKLLTKTRDIALNIGQLQQKFGSKMPAQDFVNQLKDGLMVVVYKWACGMPFAEIMQLTQVQEGLIVRCIQRLDELLKDLKGAAEVMGNPNLAEKMDETSEKIRRDIVFAASLYIQDDEGDIDDQIIDEDELIGELMAP
ncbi:helicase SKI2W [Tetranychus urticae]|uniref:helicase SKI2W n=1 Tax=Tetranychus urticae TaxID=32264 RepID=UPI000D64E04B|nr:helicase SKI2W [Tetranychus urticae]